MKAFFGSLRTYLTYVYATETKTPFSATGVYKKRRFLLKAFASAPRYLESAFVEAAAKQKLRSLGSTINSSPKASNKTFV